MMLLLAGGSLIVSLHAELSTDQKKKLFLKSHPLSQKPPAASTHASSKKGSAKSGANSTHHHFKKHSLGSGKSGIKPLHSHPSGTVPPLLEQTPPAPPSSEPVMQQAAPHTPFPSETIQPSPLPLPHGAIPSAPITIEKSGIEQPQGMEPAPASSSSGFFGWLFGGGSHRSYTYLSAATRAAIDHAPVRRGRWKYIIVHNSGTREGNARIFDIYHLRVRHMKNGLAYHFVIGDGHGSGDGQIETGHRWTAQLNGGHVASDFLNDISLGICLVGDFNRDLPTKAQIEALQELIEYLRNRVGKTQGRQAIIYAHKEINPRPTDCPGDRFPYSWLHAKFH